MSRRVRDKIKVPPLPKNMNPIFCKGRCKARAESLQAKCAVKQDVLYTEAAKYEGRAAYVTVAVREDGSPVACCTIGGVTTAEAQEMATALAASQQGVRVTKDAARNYESGRLTEAAAQILNGAGGPKEQVLLVWAPGPSRTRRK